MENLGVGDFKKVFDIIIKMGWGFKILGSVDKKEKCEKLEKFFMVIFRVFFFIFIIFLLCFY